MNPEADTIWSILVPSLKERNDKFQKLMDDLRGQVQRWNSSSRWVHRVEVVYLVDDGTMTSGAKRQQLLHGSSGRYVSFVDDDDLVSPDYVVTIADLLPEIKPDVVTFSIDGTQGHWQYRVGIEDDRPNGLMAANHLCVWKRELAQTIGWCPYLGYGDDQLWYKPMALIYPKLNEVHLEETLYTYQYSPKDTVNQNNASARIGYAYGEHGVDLYWLDGEYVMESNAHQLSNNPKRYADKYSEVGTYVINSKGQEILVPLFNERAQRIAPIYIK